jgi:hypothetical protein
MSWRYQRGNLCCLFFFEIRIWLPLWYLQDIMLSVLLWNTDSDYPFVSSRHCVVYSFLIYGFWRADITTFWRYKEVIWIRNSMKNRQHNVFKISKGWSGSVNRGRTDIRILITPLVSSRHYIVCSYLIYGLWLPLWYLQDIMLSVLLWNTNLITPSTQCAEDTEGVIKSVYRRRTDNIMSWRYQRGNQIRTSPLVSSRHCVVCSSLIYGFWLPLWYLQTLCCLFFIELRILITSLYLQNIVMSG